MSKLIVTGAAGFIGRNLVAALNARGERDIILVDRLGTGEKWRNLVGLHYEDFLDKDVFRETLWDDLFDDVQAVFHLGACSTTTETDADYLADNNYAYSRELCTWCLGREARFIYASSAATYGDGSQGYSDADDVTPTLRPLNMYGYSKHMFDLWALQNGLLGQVVGLKYFNVYGPYEDHKGDMRSMVHKAYGQIRDSGEVALFRSHRPDYADGEQQRDFLWIDDAVGTTLWFYDHPDVHGLYNCGTGRAETWNSLARATFAVLDREARIRYVDMPETIRATYQYFTQADMSKLQAAGCTAVPASLEEGVRSYVQSYLLRT